MRGDGSWLGSGKSVMKTGDWKFVPKTLRAQTVLDVG